MFVALLGDGWFALSMWASDWRHGFRSSHLQGLEESDLPHLTSFGERVGKVVGVVLWPWPGVMRTLFELGVVRILPYRGRENGTE